MNKKLAMIFSVFIMVVFIAYIAYDTTRPEHTDSNQSRKSVSDSLQDKWMISDQLLVSEGSLKAVSVASDGNIYAGGESFVSCYGSDLKLHWSTKTQYPVTALSVCGDTVFASTVELILVIGKNGKVRDEWGPFEDNSFITSVASNRKHVVYADAGNKMVVVLDKEGRVEKIIGQSDGRFVLPSPYFDVAIDRDDNLYVANTGHRRIETLTLQGKILSTFGEPGLAAGAFCGCCNPAHFVNTPAGFITAEKGLNRIKVLGKSGEFIEFVSSKNKFLPSLPLDLASADGKIIWAANSADSKLYKFIHR